MNGFCTHTITVKDPNATFGWKRIVEKRDIFSCPTHKNKLDYSDHVYKSKHSKPIERDIAPPTARPKWSRGDYPKVRIQRKTVAEKGRGLIKTEDGKGHIKYYLSTKDGISRILKRPMSDEESDA